MEVSEPMPPAEEKTNGVKLTCSTSSTRCAYSRFFPHSWMLNADLKNVFQQIVLHMYIRGVPRIFGRHGGNNHAHLKFWSRPFQFLWPHHKSFDAGLLTLRCHKLLSQNTQAQKEQSGLSFKKKFLSVLVHCA